MKRRVPTNNTEARALINALSAEDKILMELKNQLDAMRISWQLAMRKYTAVRDLFIEKFGVNPYSVNPSDFGANPFQSQGRFRFLRINPGEAAEQVLMEAEQPMALDEIVERLRSGGLAIIDARTVSAAALIKKSGIKQLPDGKYQYDPEEEDEIPFE